MDELLNQLRIVPVELDWLMRQCLATSLPRQDGRPDTTLVTAEQLLRLISEAGIPLAALPRTLAELGRVIDLSPFTSATEEADQTLAAIEGWSDDTADAAAERSYIMAKQFRREQLASYRTALIRAHELRREVLEMCVHDSETAHSGTLGRLLGLQHEMLTRVDTAIGSLTAWIGPEPVRLSGAEFRRAQATLAYQVLAEARENYLEEVVEDAFMVLRAMADVLAPKLLSPGPIPGPRPRQGPDPVEVLSCIATFAWSEVNRRWYAKGRFAPGAGKHKQEGTYGGSYPTAAAGAWRQSTVGVAGQHAHP